MPIITSSYRAHPLLFNGHLETIWPYLFRRFDTLPYARERWELPDGDFLDLDWCRQGARRLVVLCHGLEGGASSSYMVGMTHAAQAQGWDVLALNFRSCSGEMNRLLRMYHHGEITDLTYVLDRLVDERSYDAISLCGYSLGGNVILKYLGTKGANVPLSIRSAVAVSVPCDLASSSEALDQWQNYLYTRRFRRSLREKFEQKARQFPGVLDLSAYDSIKSWYRFDNTYTTALTEFESADEYYRQGSANNFLAGIRTPTLLINALNDPFLQSPSFPKELVAGHDFVYLEIPETGGHVGFWKPGEKQTYAEHRACQFIEDNA